MKIPKMNTSALNASDGKHPEAPVAYLAPSVGTFTLFAQGTDGAPDTMKGTAAFVWFHKHDEPHDGHSHEHLVLDWHLHGLTYAGSTIDNRYWAYSIVDPGGDADVEYVLFAKTRTDSGVDHGGATDPSDSDEGYRIYYVAHGEYHFWAWDARTFVGHHEAHDESHNH